MEPIELPRKRRRRHRLGDVAALVAASVLDALLSAFGTVMLLASHSVGALSLCGATTSAILLALGWRRFSRHLLAAGGLIAVATYAASMYLVVKGW